MIFNKKKQFKKWSNIWFRQFNMYSGWVACIWYWLTDQSVDLVFYRTTMDWYDVKLNNFVFLVFEHFGFFSHSIVWNNYLVYNCWKYFIKFHWKRKYVDNKNVTISKWCFTFNVLDNKFTFWYTFDCRQKMQILLFF